MMNMESTMLLFLRLTLANAYDQQDWPRVQDVCRQIDELALEKARCALQAMEESVG